MIELKFVITYRRRKTMIKNAIIESTMIGREDNGIMTFMILIKDEYDKSTKTIAFQAKSMEVISKILKVVGAKTWEELPGKYIRFEDKGLGVTITKIGNITEDKWFDILEFFNKERRNQQ